MQCEGSRNGSQVPCDIVMVFTGEYCIPCIQKYYYYSNNTFADRHDIIHYKTTGSMSLQYVC